MDRDSLSKCGAVVFGGTSLPPLSLSPSHWVYVSLPPCIALSLSLSPSLVYPSLSHTKYIFSLHFASLHQIKHLSSLSLQSDPYWTVGSLTGRDRNRIRNLTVCSLVEMLRLAARANRSALLYLRRPPPEHPHYKTWIMDTLWAVQRSGISQKRVRRTVYGSH